MGLNLSPRGIQSRSKELKGSNSVQLGSQGVKRGSRLHKTV